VHLTDRVATMFKDRSGRRDYANDAVGALSPSPRGVDSAGARTAWTLRTRLLSLTAAILVLLLLMAAQAQATTGHTSTPTTFGAAGAGPGQFTSGPASVAVGTAGTVFATDPSNSRIESFSATGTFKSEFPINPAEYSSPAAIAVDSSVGGGVYVAVTNVGSGLPAVVKYSSTGTFDYELDPGTETSINAGPITVDPSTGTVYTTAASTSTFQQVIDSFNGTTGAFIASFTSENGSPDGGFFCPPSLLSADNAGHVYVMDPCKNRLDKYSDAGTYEATIDNGSRGGPLATATNPESGDLYVAEAGASGTQVTYFPAAAGIAPQTFSATAIGGLAGLAVGPDATVYAADNVNSNIALFAPFEGPTVASETPSPIEATAATLIDTVNSNGKPATYHYEYGTEETYGMSTPEENATPGSVPATAPREITGLVPNTTYHFRIVASNASGSILGEDQTFTTAAAPPAVDGSPAFATPIAPTEARVHATVNPKNSPTTFVIEYGTTTGYGSTAPEVPGEAGSAFGNTPVATTLTGLQPGTLYHYRVSAENGTGGPQQGIDNTFITAPAAPATGTELTTKRAILTGTINPHGQATTYRFNYGPSTSYGASTQETSGGSANGEHQVTEPITGLSPGTTYHVQVVATTNGIVREGADGTFTTAPAPEAAVTDPTTVTTGGATFQGTANTYGLGGTFHFEVSSLDGSYTANTAEQSLLAAAGSQAVSFADSSLPPATTFRVRLAVTSNEATGFSESVTFATPALPPEGFPVPPAPSAVYGCNAPHLNAYNAKVAPGSTIAVGGSDLGMAGTVLLGEESLNPASWSASGFSVQVPVDAVGTLALTINCGKASNTIAVATTKAAPGPSSAFTIPKKSVKGSTATLTVSLPGAGRLQTYSGRTKATNTTVSKAGTQTVKVALSKAGAKALKKAKKRKLAVSVRLRFTPTGGSAATQTVTVTFTRKAGK
jgi:hypothetical protein